MNKFFELLKVNVLMAMLQLNFGRSKKGKKKFSTVYMLIIGIIAIMIYMGWVANTVFDASSQYGFGWLIVVLALYLASIITLVTGIYSVNDVLFESKDLDQLFSYPITPLQILFSKLFGLVIENWIIGIMFYFPMIAVYSYHTIPDVSFYIYGILGFLCLPLIPISIFIIMSYILNIITNGKRAKNTISTIIIFGFIFGMVFGFQHLLGEIETTSIFYTNPLDSFSSFYPPLGYLAKGIITASLSDFLIGILWNVLPFSILAVVLSFGYKSLWSKSRRIYKSQHKKLTFGVNTPFATLIKKELIRYASSVMYVLNSSIGMVLLTVFSIMSGKGGDQIQQLEALFQEDKKILFVLLIFGFALILSNTTSPSISLEGKNLWIIQTWPVSEKMILMAKLMVHLLVTIPLLFINSIIVAFSMNIGLGNSMIIFITGTLFAILGGIMGLNINLHFHRFDFNNDIQVVKNSASVILTYLTMMGVLGVIAGVYWLLSDVIILYWYLIAVNIVLVGIVVVSGKYLLTRGIKVLKNIS